MDTRELKIKAVEIRKSLLTMIYNGKTGHTGGALSSVDILTALFYEIMSIDPKNPKKIDRDRFILSKGHSVEGYYAILADLGFFDKSELASFSKFNSRLIGHPNNKVPGVEMNTGALGHGLSVAVGMAIGLKKQEISGNIYVLMGDGELAEGSVWEASMAASHYKLDNIVAIIDRNHLQISGITEDVMSLEPLAERFGSFGFSVKQINGHDMNEIVSTFKSTPFADGKPSLIIANTIKGKGVSPMENIAKWHHGVPDEELYNKSMEELEKTLKELRVDE